MTDSSSAAAEFWNKLFSQGQAGDYSRIEMPDLENPILRAAVRHFGDVSGKTVIDLGCGRGATSLYLARLGANVLSVDLSSVAISNLTEYCRSNSISNISPIQIPAQEIGRLGPVDFVFGSMILHHIEPFDKFANVLRSTIRPGGKAFFWENSAKSKAMIWFRQNIVGKLWIPKYGDRDEFPLTPSEIAELQRHFQVVIEYPELLYFRLISRYLLRGRMMRPFEALDRYFYKWKSMRKYSYRQYLFLSEGSGAI